MTGGIDAYNGLTVAGGPEAGMAWFPDDATSPQLTAFAWLLEDGTGKFYKAAYETICKEDKHKKLIATLEAAEQSHKAKLLETCSEIMDRKPVDNFPEGIIELPEEDTMEGGVKVAEALEWAKGRDIRDVLELMISLEANALDLYVRMSRRVDDKAAKIFTTLADEERAHLEKLAGALRELG